MRTRIESVLSLVNGKRRTRLLDYDDIIRLIAECLTDGVSTTGGGTVANAYKYPASQTVACAVQRNGSIYLAVGEKSATEGSSQIPRKVPPHITKNLNKWDGAQADIILTVQEARLLIRRWRRERGEFASLPKSYWDVLVTCDDSLAVGNCDTYTKRIAEAIGGEIATGKQVYDYCKRHHQDQLSRAVLAIKHAASRAVATA